MDRVKAAGTAAVGGGLAMSPAWATYLGHVNVLLTTATLVVGLVIGILQIRSLLRKRKPTTTENS